LQRWNFYTTNELKPSGWLKRQLQIQAEGLAGNLDKMWPDVQRSAWIGGDREGWERVPYWLDGFIPLAYLLEDEDLIARAKKYIDAIIAAQQPDGWICPCTEEERPTYTTWVVFLITKALALYYDCSKDERIPEVIYRTLKNYYELLRDGVIKLLAGRRSGGTRALSPLILLIKDIRKIGSSSFASFCRSRALIMMNCSLCGNGPSMSGGLIPTWSTL